MPAHEKCGKVLISWAAFLPIVSLVKPNNYANDMLKTTSAMSK